MHKHWTGRSVEQINIQGMRAAPGLRLDPGWGSSAVPVGNWQLRDFASVLAAASGVWFFIPRGESGTHTMAILKLQMVTIKVSSYKNESESNIFQCWPY